MNEVEENAFLSQATDKVEAAYYRRQEDQAMLVSLATTTRLW
jgi:hypothetical protein